MTRQGAALGNTVSRRSPDPCPEGHFENVFCRKHSSSPWPKPWWPAVPPHEPSHLNGLPTALESAFERPPDSLDHDRSRRRANLDVELATTHHEHKGLPPAQPKKLDLPKRVSRRRTRHLPKQDRRTPIGHAPELTNPHTRRRPLTSSTSSNPQKRAARHERTSGRSQEGQSIRALASKRRSRQRTNHQPLRSHSCNRSASHNIIRCAPTVRNQSHSPPAGSPLGIEDASRGSRTFQRNQRFESLYWLASPAPSALRVSHSLNGLVPEPPRGLFSYRIRS